MKTVLLLSDAAILRFITRVRDDSTECFVAMVPAKDPSGRIVGLYALTYPTEPSEDDGWSREQWELWRAARVLTGGMA